MPRAGLSPSAVVDVALDVLDEHGPEGLTLAAVAGRAGVATPSLYKHVAGLAELRTRVAVRVLDDMAGRLSAVVMGRSTDDAVAALMHEYRAYATTHPARYAAVPYQPLNDAGLDAAGSRLLKVFLSVLRGYDLEGSAAIHATRCCRAAVHGFVSIEIAGGFGLPEGLDTTYEQLVAMVVASLPHP